LLRRTVGLGLALQEEETYPFYFVDGGNSLSRVFELWECHGSSRSCAKGWDPEVMTCNGKVSMGCVRFEVCGSMLSTALLFFQEQGLKREGGFVWKLADACKEGCGRRGEARGTRNGAGNILHFMPWKDHFPF